MLKDDLAFEANTYYTLNNSNFVLASEFDPYNTYYEVTPADVTVIENLLATGNYFIKNGDNYVVQLSDYDNELTYYTLAITEAFTNNSEYYVLNDNGSYSKEEFEADTTYYKISTVTESVGDFEFTVSSYYTYDSSTNSYSLAYEYDENETYYSLSPNIVSLVKSAFTANKYYTYSGESYNLASSYDPTEIYYELKATENTLSRYTYTKNQYYLLENGIYVLSTEDYNSSNTYYELSDTEVDLLENTYRPNTYYVMDSAYKEATKYIEGTQFFEVTQISVTSATFDSATCFIKNSDGTYKNAEAYSQYDTYYSLTPIQFRDYNYYQLVNSDNVVVEEIEHTVDLEGNPVDVTIYNTYQKNTYSLATTYGDSSTVRIINNVSITENEFTPNTYYEIDNEGLLVLATTFTENTAYYTMEALDVSASYAPNTYYVVNKVYVLATEYDENATYYERIVTPGEVTFDQVNVIESEFNSNTYYVLVSNYVLADTFDSDNQYYSKHVYPNEDVYTEVEIEENEFDSAIHYVKKYIVADTYLSTTT